MDDGISAFLMIICFLLGTMTTCVWQRLQKTKRKKKKHINSNALENLAQSMESRRQPLTSVIAQESNQMRLHPTIPYFPTAPQIIPEVVVHTLVEDG